MILVKCDQGSEEWHRARAGVITASMFRVARERVSGLTELQQGYVNAVRSGESPELAAVTAGYKTKPKITPTMERAILGLPVGDYSEAAKNYAFGLAIERIGGMPLDEGFQTWQMKRGHEMEPAARLAHEVLTGLNIMRAGFVLTDDLLFGASADGLIGDDGGSEYKCLVSPEKLRDILLNDDISDYIDQVQGCMYVTDRKYWEFCLYCPALEVIGKALYRVRIERDDDYIEALEADLVEFAALVTKYERTLRQPAKVEPQRQPELEPA